MLNTCYVICSRMDFPEVVAVSPGQVVAQTEIVDGVVDG